MRFEEIGDFEHYKTGQKIDPKKDYWACASNRSQLELLEQEDFLISGYDPESLDLIGFRMSKESVKRTSISKSNPLNKREAINRINRLLDIRIEAGPEKRTKRKFEIIYRGKGDFDPINNSFTLTDEGREIETMTLIDPIIESSHHKAINELEEWGFLITGYFPGLAVRRDQRVNYVIMGNPTTPTSAVDPTIEERVQYFQRAFSQTIK